jgi:Cdc6-like AAA superfamily ATPase
MASDSIGITKELFSSLLCREEEFSNLYYLLEQGPNFFIDLPPHIYVWGPPATGKTFVVNLLIQKLNLTSAFCDCSLHSSASSLFRSILKQLNGQVSVSHITENFFVSEVKTVFQNNKEKPFLIVLEKPEKLKEKKITDCLEVLLNLSFYSHRNICILMTSHLPFENFLCPHVYFTPIKIFFRSYNKEEIKAIILSKCLLEEHVPSLSVFIDLVCKGAYFFKFLET